MRRIAILVCAAALVVVAGCTGGGFTALVSDDELPVESPPAPYPTAPYPTAIDPAMVETVLERPNGTRPAEEHAPTVPSAARVSAPTPIATPLATVPAPLQRKPPGPMLIEMPHQVARVAAAEEKPAPQAAEPTPTSPPATAEDRLPPVVSAADVRAAQASAAAPAPVPAIAAQPTEPPAVEPLGGAAIQPPEDRLAAIAQERDVLIAMLEEDVQNRKAAPGAATDLALPRQEQQLRLLYAAVDRPDDAARAVDSLSEAEREAYRHLMFGLSTWFADDQPQRGPLRAARVLRSLREAAAELAPASKLDLSHLVFCERVESFGWYTEFARNEFLPKQQVILYVEVDNFVSQAKGQHSFETELQGSYQIFDARGNIVAERKLPLDREVCRNVRRDYFLAYPIYIPDSIEPGRYRLELLIEDLKANGQYRGRKFGEGTIEFTVRN